MGIAQELRLMIWEAVVVDSYHITAAHLLRVPALLYKSGQIRSEAIDIFLQRSTFLCHVNDFNGAFTVLSNLYIHQLVESAHSYRLYRHIYHAFDLHLTINVNDRPSWSNLVSWLHAMHRAPDIMDDMHPTQIRSRSWTVLIAGCRVVRIMRTDEWDNILYVLEGWHASLAPYESRWN